MTVVHIHAPKCHYIGQIRLYGHRKWETVTGERDTAENAMAQAIMSMTEHHKRARVLCVAEWYEPMVVMETHR